MTRLFDRSEYHVLIGSGISSACVSKYANGHIVPHKGRRLEIAVLLGRDPWDGSTVKTAGRPKGVKPAPVASPQRVTEEPVVGNTIPFPVVPSPYYAPHRHIEINPCVDDGVCLAVRKAAMRPATVNTLLESKREIPCTNCLEGISRARAVAAKKVVHGDATVCGCGEEKSREAIRCAGCEHERRKGART